jgi:hypothetical protein
MTGFELKIRCQIANNKYLTSIILLRAKHLFIYLCIIFRAIM